jgi:lysozyme family protein
MAKFDECLAFTLAQEGGFVNNRFDPGGATNKGVTLKTYQAFKGNFQLTATDLQAISDADVRAIYSKWYWVPAHGDELPAGADLSVFDMAVNAGVRQSIKLLQRAAGVQDDGILGPETMAAVNKFASCDLVDKLGAVQLAFYKSLPGYVHFGHGWTHRVLARDAAACKLAKGV